MSLGRLLAAVPLWVGLALAPSCDDGGPALSPPPPTCEGDACPCEGDACPCEAGRVRCDDLCVDPSSNPIHCGACGVTCAGADQCIDGACRCPGDPDLSTDVNHCGACGRACPAAHVCEGGSCVCVPGEVSFAGEVQPIFDARCVDALCHDGTAPKGSLDLRPGWSYDALVDVPAFQTGGSCPSQPRVAPGDPEGSYLVAKLRGVGACFGAVMPPDEPLPPATIETVITWICSGAPDN